MGKWYIFLLSLAALETNGFDIQLWIWITAVILSVISYVQLTRGD